MIVRKTRLDGVLLIKPNTNFKDFRGKYIEIYNKKEYFLNKLKMTFVQDDISVSKKNVLRGIHGDQKTWKLISCLQGSFFLIVVNNNKKSKQFNEWIGLKLSEHNFMSVLIPPKFGNGHVVLTKKAIFHYKQSTYYDKKSQFTLKWNDKFYKFKWPIKKPITSIRDS